MKKNGTEVDIIGQADKVYKSAYSSGRSGYAVYDMQELL
jgi:hypothetical protein